MVTNNVTNNGKPVKPAAKKRAATKKPVAKKAVIKKKPAAGTVAKKPAVPKKKAPSRKAIARATTTENVEFRERAAKAVNDGKAKTSEALGGLSKMIESSAATIDQQVGAKYGDYARSAADAVSAFGDKINAKDVEELTEEAREFVRKSPAVAIGAAAAVGFVMARLIKAGMSNDRDDEA